VHKAAVVAVAPNVVVNVHAYGEAFSNVLDMKIWVRDAARLAFIYFISRTRTYVGG
jgi:hypothetical protein